MSPRGIGAAVLAFGVLCSAPEASAVTNDLPSEEQLRASWLGRLDGLHFTAQVRMTISWQGKREERVIEVWRDDDPERHQERLMARFRDPSDLRGFALLYVEQAGRSNDYFVYQPELDRVRRISDRAAREDIYGVDLEYLGFGVAQIEPTTITSIRQGEHEGRSVVRVEERAQRSNDRFDTRLVWIDTESWIPLRTQHLRNGQVTLDATTERVETIDGVPTPMQIRFERPLVGERVDFSVETIDYKAPIPPSYFSALSLIKKK